MAIDLNTQIVRMSGLSSGLDTESIVNQYAINRTSKN